LSAIRQKEIHNIPNKERKRTHWHVGSRLPFGGGPHAILRSRQKMHARPQKRRGLFTLLELDDRVLPVLLLAFGGGVASEEVVGEVELSMGRGAQPVEPT
jgi:hypothetical protein